MWGEGRKTGGTLVSNRHTQKDSIFFCVCGSPHFLFTTSPRSLFPFFSPCFLSLSRAFGQGKGGARKGKKSSWSKRKTGEGGEETKKQSAGRRINFFSPIVSNLR